MKSIKILVVGISLGLITSSTCFAGWEESRLARDLVQGNSESAKKVLSGRKDASSIVQKALEIAVRNLNSQKTEELVSLGGDLREVWISDKRLGTQLKYTPLLWSLENKNLVFLRKLIDLKVDVNQQVVRNHITSNPLHLASVWDSRAVQMLLDAGADMDQRDGNGNTPLHQAAFWGHAKSAQVLIERGAKRSDQNLETQRYLPIEYAAKWGNPETLKVFLKDLPLHQVNRLNPVFQFTLLHLAALNPNHSVEMIQILVDAGVDVKIANSMKEPPQIWAAKVGNLEAEELLKSLSGEGDWGSSSSNCSIQ